MQELETGAHPCFLRSLQKLPQIEGLKMIRVYHLKNSSGSQSNAGLTELKSRRRQGWSSPRLRLPAFSSSQRPPCSPASGPFLHRQSWQRQLCVSGPSL